MNPRTLVLAASALLALAAGPGCGGDSPSLSSEMDDSNYREGQQMERQGRWDEALAAYLKVIDRRGDAAPESNLDVGLIYLNHIKDPIYAIYHFRKYLELEPNSKQAIYVRGLIDAAKREFARALPGQPLESQTEHLGVEEQVERLQRENDDLRAENDALRAGGPVPATHSSTIDLGSIPSPQSLSDAPPAAEAPPAADSSSPISLAPVDSGDTGTAAISEAPGEQPRDSTPAPAASVRHHTVTRGDTLFSLALKYYGSRSKWRDIYAANRGVLASENSPLKIGMDLKIP
jgi:tetratricopeptide (TPR) repeat protein